MPNQVRRAYSVILFDTEIEVSAELGIATATGLSATVEKLTTEPAPNVLRFRPEIPLRHRLEWKTDVRRSWNGTQQRIAIYGAPRETYDHTHRLESDALAREAQRLLYSQLDGTLAVPVWHEPETLTAEAAAGTSTLTTGLVYADFQVGDQLLITNEADTVREVVTVTTLDTGAGTVTIDEALANTWPIGTTAYPLRSVLLPDAAGLRRALVNLASFPVTATTQTRRLLGGRGGTVTTFNSLPLLDEPPIYVGEAPEAYRYNSQRLDYGGTIGLYSSQDTPEVTASRTFRINDRATWAFWKAFLDTVKGRQGAFYWPSYRPDLTYVSGNVVAASVLVDAASDYVGTYWPSMAFRSVLIRYTDGTAPSAAAVLSASDQGNGTHQLLLSNLASDQVQHLELMPTARLASDTVQVEHFDTYSRLTLALTTEENPS